MNNQDLLSGIATVFFGPNDSLSRRIMEGIKGQCEDSDPPGEGYQPMETQPIGDNPRLYSTKRRNMTRR